MFTEKMMEDAICNDPEKYLGEKGLKLIQRQFSIEECRYVLDIKDRKKLLAITIKLGTGHWLLAPDPCSPVPGG
jgi:hypothetical protein